MIFEQFEFPPEGYVPPSLFEKFLKNLTNLKKPAAAKLFCTEIAANKYFIFKERLPVSKDVFAADRGAPLHPYKSSFS
jgi:hypothetical protein